MEITNTQLAKKITKLLSTKGFSENISNLFGGSYRIGLNLLGFNTLMNKVTVHLDMLCMFMTNEVICNMTCNLIITIKRSWTGL